MRSSRFTFILCLVISLALHATLLITLTRLTPPAKVAATMPAQQEIVPEMALLQPPKQDFGESKGTGDANNSSPGDQPQAGLLSRPDQAALTRDPTGQGPAAAARPAVKPQPDTPPQEMPEAPPPGAVPTPPPSPIPAFRKPEKPLPQDTPSESRNPESKSQQRPTPPQPPSPPTPPQPPQSASNGGTPMPHSDQDSDPFAKEMALEFKQGRVVARDGRQVKFARPKTNLASMVEAAEISFPAKMKLKVSVDETGHVRLAIVTQSSGSSSIDRAFMLATYESWFEPPKDAAGKPRADDVEFTITLE